MSSIKILSRLHQKRVFSSYTKVYSVTYDSVSVPRKAIFSPRETSPWYTIVHTAAKRQGKTLKGSDHFQSENEKAKSRSRTWLRDLIRTSFMMNTRWITLFIVKQYLVQIGRIDGPTEHRSHILAAIRSRAKVAQQRFPRINSG